MKPLPSQALLLETFRYDPLAGLLIWRVRPSPRSRRRVGDVAGGLGGKGYVVVTLAKQDYAAHRLIWKLVEGYDPGEDIDHINTVRTDNRWKNLREASRSVNLTNKAPINEHRGVHFIARLAKYGAQIKRHKKHYWLGSYATAEQACEAYRAAATLHGVRYIQRCACA